MIWNNEGSENSTSLHVELGLTCLATISSLFSIFGAVCILVSTATTTRRSISKYIVGGMSFADLMVALPAIMTCCYKLSKYPDDFTLMDMNDMACRVQGYFISVGYFLSCLWTTGLAQHMYLLLKFGLDVAIKAFLGLLFVSIFPFALNIYTFQAQILGGLKMEVQNKSFSGHPAPIMPSQSPRYDINWCWISQIRIDTCYWILYDVKGFEILTYFIITIYAVLAYRALCQRSEVYESSSQSKKLIIIPVLFVVSRLPGTITAMVSVATDCTTPPSQAWYLTAIRAVEQIFDNAQGWINWILFWLTVNGKQSMNRLVTKFKVRRGYDDKEAIVSKELPNVSGY